MIFWYLYWSYKNKRFLIKRRRRNRRSDLSPTTMVNQQFSQLSASTEPVDLVTTSNLETLNYNIVEMEAEKGVELTVNSFGVTKDEDVVWEYVWTNKQTNTRVKVISYGAIIRCIEVPDKNGQVKDIVMGFDKLEEYYNPKNPYFGAIVGRVANRIAHGTFQLNGNQFNVAKNWNGIHHLHGGIKGFDKYNWSGHVQGTTVILSHLSPDKNEGYPGDVLTQICCELTEDNCFKYEMTSMVTKSTPLNLTNHSYFNLAGHDAGSSEIFNHMITINADRITETDFQSIPTGKFLPVSGTPFDLRVHTNLGNGIKKLENGFDDNFCITKGSKQELAFVSRVTHPQSGRYLEVYSNQPGVQLYTANFLPDPTKNEEDLIGKEGKPYRKQGSFCLETQKFPDGVNHSNFPSTIVKPGEINHNVCIYKFGVEN